jgi:hypothetical protein
MWFRQACISPQKNSASARLERFARSYLHLCRPNQPQVVIEAEHIPVAGHHHHNLHDESISYVQAFPRLHTACSLEGAQALHNHSSATAVQTNEYL